MHKWLETIHPDLNIGNPLYDILRLPVDPILILASIGFPPETQESEGKCVAAGLNPIQINPDKLSRFVKTKQEQLPETIEINWDHQPSKDHSERIRTIKQDPELIKGCYIEPLIYEFNAPGGNTINNEDL